MSEVYIEFQRNGAYLKCTAVDPQTAEEASAMGPANDPEGVKRLAIQKLRNKLDAKKPQGGGNRGGGISV